MVKFMEKIALITGGTSGIGLECAKKFLVNKINVILVGRNKDKYFLASIYLSLFLPTKIIYHKRCILRFYSSRYQ